MTSEVILVSPKLFVRVTLLAAAVGFASAYLLAAPSPQAPNLRIEGDWVRTDPEGSGSFGGLAANFPQAVLTPEAQAGRGRGGGGRGGRGGGGAAAAPAGRAAAAAPAGRGPLAPGQAVVTNAMPCGGRGGYGGLLITPDSGGVHFVEGKDEVIFAGERGGVRHIYVDGRKHPEPSRWTPTAAGHSIGRYEGNTLIVDTVGFTAGAVPGGGLRTAETVLVERFDVAADGKTMTVMYTWTDPKVYVTPHTYRLIFERAPTINGYSWALDEWCDASDPAEGQSIVPPQQLK